MFIDRIGIVIEAAIMCRSSLLDIRTSSLVGHWHGSMKHIQIAQNDDRSHCRYAKKTRN